MISSFYLSVQREGAESRALGQDREDEAACYLNTSSTLRVVLGKGKRQKSAREDGRLRGQVVQEDSCSAHFGNGGAEAKFSYVFRSCS